MNHYTHKNVRESFFNTMFVLLGHIANCDGYVNRNEIKRTQSYMKKMKLSDHCKQQALRLFRQGSSPQFKLIVALDSFKSAVERNPQLTEVLLVYLISVARVDGLLVDKEIKIVKQVAEQLGYTSIIFAQMLRMIAAQEDSYQSSESDKFKSGTAENHAKTGNSGYGKEKSHLSTHDIKESAYVALGVPVGADKAEVKKSYRRLVSQYHPDKIIGQGLPPEFINAANDYFKRIQAAYDSLVNPATN